MTPDQIGAAFAALAQAIVAGLGLDGEAGTQALEQIANELHEIAAAAPDNDERLVPVAAALTAAATIMMTAET